MNLIFVCPILSLDKITASFLDFLKPGRHSPRTGLIEKSLLKIQVFHKTCHLFKINLLIFGLKSVKGILKSSRFKSKADLAAESALSLPEISI